MSFQPLQPGSYLPANSITDRNIANLAITSTKIDFGTVDKSNDISGNWSTTTYSTYIRQDNANTIVTGPHFYGRAALQVNPSTYIWASSNVVLPTGNVYSTVTVEPQVDNNGQHMGDVFMLKGNLNLLGVSAVPPSVNMMSRIIPTQWSANGVITEMSFTRYNIDPFTIGGNVYNNSDYGTLVRTL
jgi:hypothetical protein